MTDVMTATPELESPDSSASATTAAHVVEPLAPGTAGTLEDPATRDLPRPGSMPTLAQASAAGKDRTLTSDDAIALARDCLAQVTEPLSVGEHMAARPEGERVITHLFECNLAGYRGWRWAVTLTRVPRSRTATVSEMALLPGEEALLSPVWVPWADRLQPGDISRSDRLPRRETDERLEPGWEATADGEGDATPDGLVLAGTDAVDFGRARVLSPQGVQRAAQRWYDGDHGPQADGVRKAHATCSTCGFFLPMAGPMRAVFGVCANEWAADDGRVVSLDHGCGAHSETDLPDQGPEWPVAPSRLDEAAMEPIGTDGVSLRDGVPQAQAVAEAGSPAQPVEGVGTPSGQEPAGPEAGAQDTEAGEAGAPAPADPEPAGTEAPEPAARAPRRRTARRTRKDEPTGSTGATGVAEPARPARRRSRKAEAAAEPAGRPASQPSAGTPEQDRHAAALTAALADTAPGRRPAPAALAELEAVLPFRD
ncbi:MULTISPECIES: DUF3027 domain-containing protein [unclassified Actinomyces]|uniref:DUF3027 domain-containing protein n=1 Tax=unclassified Actinomyces TaxID=2609248 RepID=UPI002892ED46|nr:MULTISPECIES: DUF3027 domain-containing protein [unclassified Actinomyces]